MVEYNTVISPCVSICKVDKQGICIGCYRSVDEIRAWYDHTTTIEMKRQFLENIEQRKKSK